MYENEIFQNLADEACGLIPFDRFSMVAKAEISQSLYKIYCAASV